MIVVYFDASALAKRYAPEDGSELIDEIFKQLPPSQLTCSMLGILEVVSILVRKGNDRRLPAQSFARAMREFNQEVIRNPSFRTMPVDDPLLRSAIDLIEKHSINASDALVMRSVLNLKTALIPSQDRIVFLCSDRRLIRAAKLEGLEVFDPEANTLEQLNRLLSNQPT